MANSLAVAPHAPRALISLKDTLRRCGGIHRATARRWWEQGILPTPMKLGNSQQSRLFFDAAELDAALAQIGKRIDAAA